MNNPCKDCTRRELKCHATCEEYIEWKAEWDRVKKIEKTDRHLHGELNNVRNTALKKLRRV